MMIFHSYIKLPEGNFVLELGIHSTRKGEESWGIMTNLRTYVFHGFSINLGCSTRILTHSHRTSLNSPCWLIRHPKFDLWKRFRRLDGAFDFRRTSPFRSSAAVGRTQSGAESDLMYEPQAGWHRVEDSLPARTSPKKMEAENRSHL